MKHFDKGNISNKVTTYELNKPITESNYLEVLNELCKIIQKIEPDNSPLKKILDFLIKRESPKEIEYCTLQGAIDSIYNPETVQYIYKTKRKRYMVKSNIEAGELVQIIHPNPNSEIL